MKRPIGSDNINPSLSLSGVQFGLCESSKYVFYLRYEAQAQ